MSSPLPVLRQLECLQPFGMANPAPVFAVNGVEILQARRVGYDGKHLKLLVRDPETGLEVGAIGFRMGELENCLGPNLRVDLAFKPTINQWEEREEVQLELRDIRLAPQMPLLAAKEAGAALEREPMELVDARACRTNMPILPGFSRKGSVPWWSSTVQRKALPWLRSFPCRVPRSAWCTVGWGMGSMMLPWRWQQLIRPPCCRGLRP